MTPKTQAQPRHASNRIGVLTRPLKTRVVCRTGRKRKPPRLANVPPDVPPWFFALTARAVHATVSPPCSETPVKTVTSEPPSITKPSMASKLSSSDFSLGHVGEIPTFRRRRPSHAAASIQDAVPSQDAADRRNCGTRLNLSGLHFSVNGRRSEFAQHALFLQPFSQPPQHFPLDIFARCVAGGKEPANDPTNRPDRGVFLAPIEPSIERYTTQSRSDEPRNAPRLFCVEQRQPGGDVDRQSAF